jgi:hypothetical protein
MVAKAGTLTLPGTRLARRRTVWLIFVSGFLAAGLVIGLVALTRGGSPGASAPNRVAVLHPASGTLVTGTGPGLVQIADRSLAVEPAVTGTGPGLVHVADGSSAPSEAQVTGTGPGLVQIAGARR